MIYFGLAGIFYLELLTSVILCQRIGDDMGCQ
jgi:hypothetical protein